MDTIMNNNMSGSFDSSAAPPPPVSNPSVGNAVQPQVSAPQGQPSPAPAPQQAQPAVQTTVPEHNDPWAAYKPAVAPIQHPQPATPGQAQQDPWAAYSPQQATQQPQQSQDPFQDNQSIQQTQQPKLADQLRAWADKESPEGTHYPSFMPGGVYPNDAQAALSTPEARNKTIAQDSGFYASSFMRSLVRGVADYLDFKDNPWDEDGHMRAPTPDMANISMLFMGLRSPGTGAGKDIAAEYAAAHPENDLSDLRAPAPLETNLSKISPDTPIKQYENAQQTPKQAALEDVEQQISHLQSLGTNDAAGKAQLDALQQRAKELSPDTTAANSQTPLGKILEDAKNAKDEPENEPLGQAQPEPLVSTMLDKDGKRVPFDSAKLDSESTPAENEATAAAAKAKSQAGYKSADMGAQVLDRDKVGAVFDAMRGPAPTNAIERASSAADPVTAFLEKYKDARNEPMSLNGATILDQELGDMVSKEYTSNGLTADGKKLLNAKQALVDAIKNEPAYGPIAQAKQDWVQYSKLKDIEKIEQRAEAMPNKATALTTYLNTYLNNARNTRGWTTDELAAARDAVHTGVGENLLKVLGNKMSVPIAAATEAATGGISSGAIAWLVAHGVSSAAKLGAAGIKSGQIQELKSVLAGNQPKQGLLKRGIKGASNIAAKTVQKTAGAINDVGSAAIDNAEQGQKAVPGLLGQVNQDNGDQ